MPRNKFEEELAKQLKKAKVKYEYERTRLPFTLTGWYIPDFTVSGPDGQIFIEGKGYLRPEAKRKMVSVKRANPEADIRFVFQSSGTSKQGRSYAKWATKNGFPFSFGTIPLEWIKS